MMMNDPSGGGGGGGGLTREGLRIGGGWLIEDFQ